MMNILGNIILVHRDPFKLGLTPVRFSEVHFMQRLPAEVRDSVGLPVNKDCNGCCSKRAPTEMSPLGAK